MRPGPQARATFEWILDGQFLMQRTHLPVPEAPDSLIVVGADPQTGGYSQHYYDSRGVTRRYAMTFDAGVWRLVRDAPDVPPLDFCQRFMGTFSDDRTTINGVWEKSFDGATWSHDFALTYRRIGWRRRTGAAALTLGLPRFDGQGCWFVRLLARAPPFRSWPRIRRG